MPTRSSIALAVSAAVAAAVLEELLRLLWNKPRGRNTQKRKEKKDEGEKEEGQRLAGEERQERDE